MIFPGSHCYFLRLANTNDRTSGQLAVIDGALLSWPIHEEGMLDFQKKALPLLKQVGLR
jgi:hypothetical protein